MTKTSAAAPNARPILELPRSPFETSLDIFGAMQEIFSHEIEGCFLYSRHDSPVGRHR